MNTKVSTSLPYLALTGAVLLWAGSFIAMRIAVAVIPPGLVVWLRMAITLLILLPFYRIFISSGFQTRDLYYLLPMVLLQPCLYFLCESTALTLTTASQAGIISSIVPILVALGAMLFLKEPMSPRQWLALALSVAGVVGLTLGGNEDSAGSAANPMLGNVLEFLAMVMAAGNFILIKHLSGRYSTWSLTAYQILAGFFFFLPAAAGLPALPFQVWTGPVLVSVLFLGVFVTFGGFGLYNYGQRNVPAARASLFINLIPVVTAFLGWMILAETLSPVQIISGVVVISAVRIGSNPRLKPKPAAA
ncbi:hypothetical protein B4O97_10715 [Marispirochaeta aestuarii]|uniref:EamA domain-containing protein n=1 Tax=Marispirochaeta aestuarii TaxID=1963862 RepID=A0A1Y1RYB8_9SPIO|nr:DMT family transporter [Marispirochaeta aestuarii]ORC34802.1 hypothetical protein B4O97_10715 [Marispirochaeta aestuarii]